MLSCIRTIIFIISDESPSTCEMFLGEGGLDLFMQILEVRGFNSVCAGTI